MALTDRKIPILTGINDTPSTTGQANHPNASLLCKRYNDLIDGELTALEQAISNNASLPLPNSGSGGATAYYWVDSVNGSDTTGDGTTTPYQTIARLHERIALDGVGSYFGVYLSGTFTNPDFNLLPYSHNSFNSNDRSTFYIMGYENGQGSKIIVDNDYANGDLTNARQWLRGLMEFNISDLEIEFTANASLLLDGVAVTFNNITFDGLLAQWESRIIANNCKITLSGIITYIKHASAVRSPILANNSTIVLIYSYADWGGFTTIVEGYNNIVWNLAPDTDTSDLLLAYSQVFKNATTGVTVTNASGTINHIVTI